MDMQEILAAFASEPLFAASEKFLKYLGVKTSTQTAEPIPFLELYEDNAKDAGVEVPKPIKKLFGRVAETFFVGSVTDDTLHGNEDAVSFADESRQEKYEGMFVFAVRMNAGEELTRSDAALLTRGINRIVHQQPAIVLILEDTLLSVATCERTPYKQAWRPGEKLGKVSILKGVNCLNPHRGHIDILDSMNVKEAKSFDDLYSQWKDVFSSKLLTKQFYREIQNWYFWALKPEQNIRFPNAIHDDSDDDKFNNENIIRLITRLIFTWFLKEKGLVNPKLFDANYVKTILKDFDPEATLVDPKTDRFPLSCNYYTAILQNLFFATFNQEIKNRVFVSSTYKDVQKCKVKNYYRNAKLFVEPDEKKILAYFADSPAVNGGLFECLDDIEQLDKSDGKVKTYRWDGFSESFRDKHGDLKRALIANKLFFAKEEVCNLTQELDSKSAKAVKVRGLIRILENYCFTIEESTPLDEEVALDPELLGKVFENLLGCYNPETQKMARNATGSFYTPREIVTYMVKESIVSYLERSVPEVAVSEVRQLVEGREELDRMPSVQDHAEKILQALFKMKILDPACGSGAFPMGIMSVMVSVLSKIDPTNKYWHKIVLHESLEEAKQVGKIEDEEERAKMQAEIEAAFDSRSRNPDYARKLYVIQHCIFGGDIQPIAVQISRLRFFITLLCEQQRTDDASDNYGIIPLPNLENNFVAANSLLSIDIGGMREIFQPRKVADARTKQGKADKIFESLKAALIEKVEELRETRHQLFLPKDTKAKAVLQKKDDELRRVIEEMAVDLYDTRMKEHLKYLEAQLANMKEVLFNLTDEDKKDNLVTISEGFGAEFGDMTKVVVAPSKEKNLLREIRDCENKISDIKSQSKKTELLNELRRLVKWNPFSFNVSEDFLDPEWMFGVKEGFDIVIGNPPYIQLQNNHGELGNLYKDVGFKTFVRTGDIYSLFYERGWELLNAEGSLCYITSNKWMRAGYGEATRKFFADNTNPLLLIDFAGEKIFESATVDTNILLLAKGKNEGKTLACIGGPDCCNDLSDFVKQNSSPSSFTTSDAWIILSPIEQSIKRKIESVGTPLKDWDIQINYGIKTGCNEAFIISSEKRKQILAQCATKEERERTDALIRPILRGRDIKRYGYEWADLWLIATFPSKHYDIEQFPAVKKYLLSFGTERLEQTGATHIVNEAVIKARKKTSNKWFETQDSISYWDDFSKPKIVWADLARTGNAFIYDTNGFVTPNTTYLIASNDIFRLKYLVGILNSRTILKYLDWISAKLDETGWRWFKQYVEMFPIPQGTINAQSRIAALVEEAISAKADHCELKSLKVEQQIDICVFNLYGFSDEEINFLMR